MRRLFRILLNAITVLSLVLAVLVVGVWVRSFFRVDSLNLNAHGQHVGAQSARGSMLITREHRELQYLRQGFTFKTSRNLRPLITSYAYRTLSQQLGFMYGRLASSPDVEMGWVYLLPLWAPFVLFAVLPLAGLARWHFVVRARNRPGLCLTCGYDLRATPERCPECGTATTRTNP
jgi:hypothetical protein